MARPLIQFLPGDSNDVRLDKLRALAEQIANMRDSAAEFGLTMSRTNDAIVFPRLARLPRYTVATLPSGISGDKAFVTDALAPAFLVAVVGGGTVQTPVFYNGTTWVAG